LHVLGAGTAGYWFCRTAASLPLGERIREVTVVDRARIREVNAITCPAYEGAIGCCKADRLADLIRSWFPASGLCVRSAAGEVEDIDWPALAGGGQRVIVAVGLDNWSSRVTVVSDLRAAKPEHTVPVIQIGLDRDEASVAVYGSDWTDPCPACGKQVLPASTPCVVFTAGGELARGTLHDEARAAGRHAAWIAARFLDGGTEVVNTKTSLVRTSAGAEFTAFTRPARREESCAGAHDPATPQRWTGLAGLEEWNGQEAVRANRTEAEEVPS
jgi:hypothetical protein